MPMQRRAPVGPSPIFRGKSWGNELSSAAENPNRNVNWIGREGSWLFYIMVILIVRFVFSWFFDTEGAWTATHVVHGFISFLTLHWFKGSPVDNDQGEYSDKTVWEQLDNGMPWTASKKFLIAVPVVLYLLTCHYTGYDVAHLLLNTVIVLVLVVGKLPEMHRVRIFGINKTDGLDS